MPRSIRQSVIQKAVHLWETQPVFLDTETTGFNNMAEIVEISIIDFSGHLLLDTLVKPRLTIPPDAISLHGVTNEMVGDSPTWRQVWPDVQKVLKDRYVGIYNAEFDLRLMQQSHQLNSMPWRLPECQFFCIMRLYSDYYGAHKWQKLEAAGRQCGIQFPILHRAKEDSILARAVFECIVKAGK